MTYANITELFEGAAAGTAISLSNVAFPRVDSPASATFQAGGFTGQCARCNAGWLETDFFDSDASDSTSTIAADDWTVRSRYKISDSAPATDAGYVLTQIYVGEVGRTPANWNAGTLDFVEVRYDFGTKVLYFSDIGGASTPVSVAAYLDTWIDVIVRGTGGAYTYEVNDAAGSTITTATRTLTASLYRARTQVSCYRYDAGGEEWQIDNVYMGTTAADPFAGPPATVTGTVQTVDFLAGVGDPITPGPMDLVILDPNQGRAPTSVDIVLSGCVPGEAITFLLDDPTLSAVLWTATADVDGLIFAISIPIPSQTLPYTTGLIGTPVAAGTHTLTARGARDATDTFTLAYGPSPFPAVQGTDVDPVIVPGAGASWVLQDPLPGGLGSWIMHPSPTSMTEPELSKTVDVEHTTHPVTGKALATVADPGVKPWSWSGYCPNKDFYDKLSAFAALNRKVYVIDHRGRAWKTIILDPGLVPRKRLIEDDGTPQDWAHDYTVSAEVLDGRWFEPV